VFLSYSVITLSVIMTVLKQIVIILSVIMFVLKLKIVMLQVKRLSAILLSFAKMIVIKLR